MTTDVLSLIKTFVVFLAPFILLIVLNNKVNLKKEIRYKQYFMPIIAVVYSVIVAIYSKELSELLLKLFLDLSAWLEQNNLETVATSMKDSYDNYRIYLEFILFNVFILLVFVLIKKILTLLFKKLELHRDSMIGTAVGFIYEYSDQQNQWNLREDFGDARTFLKVAYYGTANLSMFAIMVSYYLCINQLIIKPFYPVFSFIIIGELAFFVDGLFAKDINIDLSVQADKSKRIAMYPLLRIPLKILFGDKLSAEGTTVNEGGLKGGAIEEVLLNLEKNGGHLGQNYATFVRNKMTEGLKPNVDYVRCGYDLANGKSLLFNTPFYDKLNPYAFYAMNHILLSGGKVLIVLGRHGTEEDLYSWCEKGMEQISNIPNLWKINVLSNKKVEEDSLPDIGIISRSGVYNLDIHKANLEFLNKVAFVVIIEPSRLVTTAQIGLNLLIKSIGENQKITFCSVDRNCDGLLDALSHILMTSITEVLATEYPHGINSYMYWTDDGDYLQHRILPGVSRCLGTGTELSMVALKNQVKDTIWYGGDAFPVLDAHWIAKQYYHDLLDYAKLPTTQETFDSCFKASFNMCNEKIRDYSFITVEDDRNNLFEIRKNFATIAEKQGFVNVISSEYMLREYMSSNPKLFTADAKAIPYLTADFARTKRNMVLSLCLLLCVDHVKEEVIDRQMILMNIDTKDPISVIWKEIVEIFGMDCNEFDKKSNPILKVKTSSGEEIRFEKESTILFNRQYSVESGRIENMYSIVDSKFANIILDDLQNASYIAESENDDSYIGTELKGHIYQKYLPGQFFTISGKYYEMVSGAIGNRILVRRASEYIDGRLSYRQVRNYTINHIENSNSMGDLKTVNSIDIHRQYADFTVETSGYWSLKGYNNFNKGTLVEMNGIPKREYHHKQVLKFDFSKFGESFTDEIRVTLTNLLNEAFVTLFADNHPYIVAITPGQYDYPLTYSMQFENEDSSSNKCIYIIEDSQLDIGLIVAVERNMHRIFQIISDYLSWNEEQIEESLKEPKVETEKESLEEQSAKLDAEKGSEEKPKKESVFEKTKNWIKNLFKKKPKTETTKEVDNQTESQEVVDVDNQVENQETVNEEVVDVDNQVESQEVVNEEVVDADNQVESQETVNEEVVDVDNQVENQETVNEEVVDADNQVESQEVVNEEVVDADNQVESQEVVNEEVVDVDNQVESQETVNEEVVDFDNQVENQEVVNEEVVDADNQVESQETVNEEVVDADNQVENQETVNEEIVVADNQVESQEVVEITDVIEGKSVDETINAKEEELKENE